MGLGLRKKFIKLTVLVNLLKFKILKLFLGFEFSNAFLRNLDKYSTLEILKRNGATIGQNCDIESNLIFHNCNDYSNLIIGNNCHIGKGCFFDLRNKIIIGNNVVISMQCSFITHIDMEKSELSKLYPSKSDAIYIGNNCYLGARSIILKGTKLNDKSFIAAGSVVVNDVESNVMVGGVPAKFIKRLDFGSSEINS
jgi:acetyltransferase-like isoleucine patch superfamily enzyme